MIDQQTIAPKAGRLGALWAKLPRSGSIGHAAVWSLAMKAAGMGLTVGSTFLLAKLLEKRDYGLYSLAISFVTLLTAPVVLGIPDLLVRETAKLKSRDAYGEIRHLARTSVRLVWKIGFAVCALAALAIPLIGGRWGNSDAWITFAVAIALIPITQANLIRQAILRGIGLVLKGQVIDLILRPALLIAALLLCLAAGFQLTAPRAIGVTVAAGVVVFGVGIVLLRSAIPACQPAPDSGLSQKELLTMALPFSCLAIVNMARSQADILLVGSLRGPDAAATYRIAQAMALIIGFANVSVNSVIGPHLARCYHEGKAETLQRIATRAARLSLGVAGGVSVLTIPAALIIVPRFLGDEYAGTFLPFLLLTVGQLINTGSGPVFLLLKMTGHEREALRGQLMALIVGIVAGLLLIPPFGAVGAAVGTVLTVATWSLRLRQGVRKQIGIRTHLFGS